MEFEPEHFQQMAGLICYYNGTKFHYLYVSHDDGSVSHLRVMSALPDQRAVATFSARRRDPGAGRSICGWKWISSGSTSRTALEGGEWTWLPQHVRREHPLRRGDRAGICRTSLARSSGWLPGHGGHGAPADFDWFEYRERQYRTDPA